MIDTPFVAKTLERGKSLGKKPNSRKKKNKVIRRSIIFPSSRYISRLSNRIFGAAGKERKFEGRLTTSSTKTYRIDDPSSSFIEIKEWSGFSSNDEQVFPPKCGRLARLIIRLFIQC